jgi:hypothetical protein
MNFKLSPVVAFLLLCCAAVGGIFLRNRLQPKYAPGNDVRLEEGSLKAPAEMNPGDPIHFESFENRLKAAPGAGWGNTPERARRAAILIEWLAADRKASMHYLAESKFEDLWLPGVAKTIGKTATSSELLLIANSASNPGEALSQIGKWSSPGVINELAGLMTSVSPNAAASTAGAVAGLLADLNLDRALAFGNSQPDDKMRSYAMSGVFDSLRSGPNGESEIRSLYSMLPPSVQLSDPIRFSYGNTIWGSDPVTALQTLEGISDPKTRMLGLMTLSQNAASSSPETAIAAAYASGVSEQGVYNRVSQIIQNWSAVDPQAASAFLTTTQIIPPADLSKYTPMVVPPKGGKG